MPGILPMKVIKMSANAHLRIAQACDRCRSKKIRCDGIRPCCTQCANVGFECKTSDKLSRRAFPRGYTESLEERVRALETEVRELKDLLDEKDEKIDILSRVHPPRLSPQTQRHQHAPPLNALTDDESGSPASSDDTVFTVQQSPTLTDDGQYDSYFAGTASGASFIESFKQKAQERGHSVVDVQPAGLLRSAGSSAAAQIPQPLQPLETRPPPRLTSDQFVNVFFQEWAPLFPILHRPDFLAVYDQFLNAPESVTDKKSIAQLYLVFGLSALSQGAPLSETAPIERQWQCALQEVQHEQTLGVLQCLLLAQLWCMQKGDCSRLLTYKSLAVALSVRLGLHQSQKRFALGTLTCELRKRIFWTLYAIDSFSAVQLGLPKQIRDDEVFCEFPVDVDDEYITEQGFQPSLPGESTRMSSALALFRAARILSKVLSTLYPALPSYELSSAQINSLDQDLDEWQSSLAPHLRLPFAQDKPSAGNVSSRSPLICLAYHYIRSLIHRPIVCTSNNSGSASSSMLAMSGSCKHIAQILSLLNERGLGFAFCLNRSELLVLSGFGLLMQDLDLDEGSKVRKDNQRTLAAIIRLLESAKAPEGKAFRKIAWSVLPAPPQLSSAAATTTSSSGQISGKSSSPGAWNIPSTVKQQLKAMTSKFSRSDINAVNPVSDQRRMSYAGPPTPAQMNMMGSPPAAHGDVGYSAPSASAPSLIEANAGAASQSRLSLPTTMTATQGAWVRSRPNLNLDYLSFSSGQSTPGFEAQHRLDRAQQADWEHLLATIDNGQTNIFDNIYGGPPVEAIQDTRADAKQTQRYGTSHADDSALAWDANVWSMGEQDFGGRKAQGGATESVFSASTDDCSGAGSMPSMDDSTSTDGHDMYRGIMMPDLEQSDDGAWDTIEGYAMA